MIRTPAGDAANAPAVVVHGGDDACDMRSVVRVFRIAVIPADRFPVEFGGVVPEIVAVFLRILRIRPDVRPQVGMGGLHGFVDHRDDNLLAARAELPGIQQVDVGPRLRLDGDIRKEASARVVVIPLKRQHRVVHRLRGAGLAHTGKHALGSRNGRAFAHRTDIAGINPVLHDRNAGQRRQPLADLGELNFVVERDRIPAVDARLLVNVLPLGIVCDDTFETPGVDFMQDCVDAADTRTGRDTAACRGPLRLRSGNRLRRFGRQLYGKTPPQRQPRSRGTQHPGLPSAIAAGRVRRLFRTGKYRQQPAEE